MASYLLTAVGALGISTAPIFYALSGADAGTGALLRFAYALPVLAGVCMLRPAARRAFGRGRWRSLGVLAGVFFALDILLYHRAIDLVGAGPATLLANTQVVWITLFGLAFLDERPRAWFWLALPVLAVGMALLCGATWEGFARAGDRLGLAYGAASGLMYAGALLCLRAAQRRTEVPPEAVLATQISAALVLVGVAAALAQGSPVADLGPSQHLWLLALALGPQVAAWFCITAGIRRLPAYRGGVLLLLQPVSSLVLGWWILDQALSPSRIAGAAMVLAGVCVALAPRR